jgi:hypothetical protein
VTAANRHVAIRTAQRSWRMFGMCVGHVSTRDGGEQQTGRTVRRRPTPRRRVGALAMDPRLCRKILEP